MTIDDIVDGDKILYKNKLVFITNINYNNERVSMRDVEGVISSCSFDDIEEYAKPINKQ